MVLTATEATDRFVDTRLWDTWLIKGRDEAAGSSHGTTKKHVK